MMYPFLTLDDQTEFVHSQKFADGTMKIYIEKPDQIDGFHSASCILPYFRWDDIQGFSSEEIARFQQIIEENIDRLISEIQNGRKSVRSENDWINEEEMRKQFGIEKDGRQNAVLRPTATKVIPMDDFLLRVSFDDGETKDFDVKPYICGNWYGELANPVYFQSVFVNGFTVAWSNGQDICPDELYYNSITVDPT